MSSTTAIAPELARELNLRDGSLSQVTTGGRPIRTSAAWFDSLRIGAAEVRDLDVVIGDFLEMLSDAIGVKLDGIVGYNFLRHYKVAIDYPNEKLSLLAA